MTQEDIKFVKALRQVTPALTKEAIDRFRTTAADRHNQLDQLMANQQQYDRLPFIEREMVRIQRDGLRAMLTAVNIQAEVLAQLEAQQAQQAPAPAEAPAAPADQPVS